MNARPSDSAKIKELGDALLDAGFLTLDQQANALGLARSTTWHILKANHKGSGLSADVINRMLRSPQLPALVRATILAYIDDKIAGYYGHSEKQLHRFAARLSPQLSHQRGSRLRTKLTAKRPAPEHHAPTGEIGRGPAAVVALADVGTQ